MISSALNWLNSALRLARTRAAACRSWVRRSIFTFVASGLMMILLPSRLNDTSLPGERLQELFFEHFARGDSRANRTHGGGFALADAGVGDLTPRFRPMPACKTPVFWHHLTRTTARVAFLGLHARTP